LEEPVIAAVIDSRAYRGYRIVKLKPRRPFEFDPGQNAEFEISQRICGECGSKTFSIASSPTEGFIMFATIVRGRETPFKRALEELKPGDEVSIWGPYGHFTLEEGVEEAVMVFHSIGVTPIRSMIVYSSDKGLPTRILAIHIDEEGDFLFREDLEEAASKNKNIDVLWLREMPRPEEVSRRIRVPERAVFYTSGPPQKVREIVSILKELGVKIARERVKIESFSGY